jgi:hypothetical protein
MGICAQPQYSLPAHLTQPLDAGVGVKLIATMIAKLAPATKEWINVFMA